MTENLTFIRICFPLDFESAIKSKGKYDLQRLYEKGIMLSINEFTENAEHSEKILTMVRMELGCHPLTPHRLMIFDIDEFKEKVALWFDFVKDNGTLGEGYVGKAIWLLRNIQCGALVFSKQLTKEMDKDKTNCLGAWHMKRHTREFPIGSEKKIYLHTTLVSTHSYLLEEPFYTDIEKIDFKILWDKLNGKKDKITRQARDPISNSLRHEVFKRDNYKCKECGRTNKETTLHIDHVIPVSQKGTDELSNLQTLCDECNLQKKNRAWRGGEQINE